MADWQRRYLNPDSGRDREESVHEFDGWEFVTDSRCLLAVRERSLHLTRPAGLLPETELHALTKLITQEPPSEARVTTLGDLWLWLDRVDRDVCRDCYGAWGADSEHCQECNGRGWVFPLPRRELPECADCRGMRRIDIATMNGGTLCGSCGAAGRRFEHDLQADTVAFGGWPFDRNRLAWWLPAELGDPGQAVTYWLHNHSWAWQAEGLQPIHFVGDGWKLVAMGLKRDQHTGVYRSYVPGAGLWWSCRRGGAFAGEDWFREQDVWDVRQMWGAVAEPEHAEV